MALAGEVAEASAGTDPVQILLDTVVTQRHSTASTAGQAARVPFRPWSDAVRQLPKEKRLAGGQINSIDEPSRRPSGGPSHRRPRAELGEPAAFALRAGPRAVEGCHTAPVR